MEFSHQLFGQNYIKKQLIWELFQQIMHRDIKKRNGAGINFCITSEMSALCSDFSTLVPNKRGKVYAGGKSEKKEKFQTVFV